MKAGAVAALLLACGVLVSGLSATRVQRPTSIPTPAADAVSPRDRVTLASYADEAEPPRRLAVEETPPDSPKQAAVRDVIDRLLKDASPDEREIFFEELKNLPPGVVEDLLNVRRQVGVARPKSPSALPPAQQTPSPLAPPSADASASGPWAEAIRAMRQAREIHLYNLANVYSPGYRRLQPLFTPLPPPGQPSSGPVGSRWEGTQVDDRASSPPQHSNVDPDMEWRAIEQIDRWLNAVAR